MSNRVCEILKIQYPIIQGAMAWTSMAPLVAAVSNAGGLGVLGSGFMPKEVIEAQVDAIREMTDKPFAANMVLDPGQQLEVSCQAIIDKKVHIAYVDTLNLLDYNMAKEYYEKLHAAGTLVIAKINCRQDAEVAERAGADIIIAKGIDGGGHCARVSSMVLLTETVQAVSRVPVLASGGIATPSQAAGCIVMGAEGIEMGTAFVTTLECTVHENVKKAIVKANDIDIVPCGYSTGEASWQVKNKLAEKLLAIEARYPRAEAAELVAKDAAGSLRIASIEGEVEERGAVMSGPVAGLIHEIKPVSDYVVSFCEEVETLLAKQYTLGI